MSFFWSSLGEEDEKDERTNLWASSLAKIKLLLLLNYLAKREKATFVVSVSVTVSDKEGNPTILKC